jgi:hypothetical protein
MGFEFFCLPEDTIYNEIEPSSQGSLTGQGRGLPQPIDIDIFLRKLRKKCTAVRVAGTMTKIQTHYLPNTSYILSLHRPAQ